MNDNPTTAEQGDLKNCTFTDPRDGKIYKIVRIGSQTWMAENLNYECEGSKFYNNDPANGEKYGRLYDWETAKKACPPGWHIPSKDAWRTLVDYVGGSDISGRRLKAKSGWCINTGTDDFGFSALPGAALKTAIVYEPGIIGLWWGSTTCFEQDNVNYMNGAYYHWMMDNNDKSHWEYKDKSSLLSVRCVQDVNASSSQSSDLGTSLSSGSSDGCYVATCVYGSYDCTEVWTLRQFRDNELSNLWLGRQFIRIYYAVSPKIVELFGNKKWFTKLWKPIIDKIVCKLQNSGNL